MKWQETPFDSELYYNELDGLIQGQVHKLGTQNIIWVAKIDEKILGQYISREFAKKAVEYYMEVQSRTLIE